MLVALRGRARSIATASRVRWPALLLPLLLVGLAAFAYAPLVRGGLILTGDTAHAWRTFEMGRCVTDGQLPCRWVPDLGNGYGYPLFNYYPPLPYYAGELLHRLDISYLRTANLLFLIGLLGAGISMYLLGRKLWGDLGGLVSAVAYVFAPYLAFDVYTRGALTELWALALVPAVLWTLYELITTSQHRYVPLVALLAALVLLSHNLVAVIMAPAIALWVVALLLTRGRESLRPALLVGVAGLWAFGLAAFFSLPALNEGGQVQLDTIAQTLDRRELLYPHNYVSVSDLFLGSANAPSPLLGTLEMSSPEIGWFHWGLAGLAVPAGFLLWRSRERRAALAVGLFCVFFGVGVFMSVSRSHFVWHAFDPLRFLQFPWRYLGLVSLASAGLAGAWLGALRDRPLRVQLAVAAAIVGILVGTGQALFHPVHRCDVSDSEYFAGARRPGAAPDRICDVLLQGIEQGFIRDYLPVAAETIPPPPDGPAQVIEGSARIVSAGASSDRLDLKIEATEDSVVQASVFDYPNWRVRIDGREVPHTASVPNGLITFDVPSGRHDVALRLENTGVRRLGNALSLASWALLAIAGAGLTATWFFRGWGTRIRD